MSMRMDPLDLPLAGIRLVEASAGTGKTFTIATLYLRLILERGWMPERIVVATFTRAATAELATRLRTRLRLASAILRQADPARSRDGEGGEAQATRAVIARALGDIDPETLTRRAHEAELGMDTAVIGTLHGFCHRILGEFGFETGRAMRAPELLEDTRALQREVVDDFWRRGSRDAQTSHLLADTWRTPEALARQVTDPRWRGRSVANTTEPPAAAGASHALRNETLAQLDAIRNAIAGWDDATLQVADAELGDCFDKRGSGARASRTRGLRRLQAWAQADTAADLLPAAVRKAVDDLGEDKLTVLKSYKRLPQGPVFAAVADLDANVKALERLDRVARTRLLLDARAFLERESPARMRVLGVLGYDQAVDELAAALDDLDRGARAIRAIRERWPVALVDEFQDTDPQQWRILKRLFAHAGGALVLVGDPKQAIYGFRGGDVHAWLMAKQNAEGEPLRLDESQRAGRGVNVAVNALFSRAAAFVEPGITHADVHAAPRVAERALLVDGVAVPGLQLWQLPPSGITNKDASPRAWNKGDAQTQIESACVAQIVEWLEGARQGRVRLREGDGSTRELRARDIAVLVNRNREARSMQRALALAGVPAASCLRASVYASEEAADLRLVLEALRDPADARRARAARATLLVGDDARRIAATCVDGAALDWLLVEIAGWAASAQRRGPLPLVHRLIANAAPRLLALPGGERRVANYLQLAELLQNDYATCFGVDDLCNLYARALRESAGDTDADALRLRLETDAQAVQIATLHAAKGLEYGVVLLPCAAAGHASTGTGRQPPLAWYHEGNAAGVAVGDDIAADIKARARQEILAEEIRKLYVGVTRARAACVIPWGFVRDANETALHWLLHAAGRDAPLSFDEAGCSRALAELVGHGEGGVVASPLPAVSARRLRNLRANPGQLAAAKFHGAPERDWQVWSFSRLVRGNPDQAPADPQPGAGDTDGLHVDAGPPEVPGPAGAAFGTAVHAVFEATEFAAWREAAGVPDSEHALIQRSLRDHGLAPSDTALQRAIELTGACVHRALNAALPCGARLCDVAQAQRRAEIEFHLSLYPARSARLYALLHEHGYQQQRRGIAPERLHGLLTGKIDLVFQHAGRFHIVDWKTNRCAPFDAPAMRAEIAAHDYDLQWLLYTLALHRWLRQRLAGYDYDRHFGGVYYLFVRGMANGGGIHVDRPPRALIDALDASFDADAGGSV